MGLNDRGFIKANEIGLIGENYYANEENKLKETGEITECMDLTKNKFFRLVDCDFAIVKNGAEYTEKQLANLVLDRLIGFEKNCELVEVKTDTVTLHSGNFYFEWIAHNGPGCFAVTKAKTWIYYAVDKDNEIKKGWSIDVKALRKAISTPPENGGIGRNDIRDYYSGDKGSENYGWLIKASILTEKGIAKEIL